MKPVLKALTTAAVLGTLCSSAQADDFWAREAVETVTGTYRTVAPEPWYGGYGIREFILQDGAWELIFTHAMDPQMVNRTFQYRAAGPYEVLGASRDVAGAFAGHFTYDWKHVTLLTDDPALQQAYGLADCGLTVGLEADISGSGCGNWRPVAECDSDYDLIALTDAGIFWGVRAADNDMCTPDKTPKALLPMVPVYGG